MRTFLCSHREQSFPVQFMFTIKNSVCVINTDAVFVAYLFFNYTIDECSFEAEQNVKNAFFSVPLNRMAAGYFYYLACNHSGLAA